MWVENGGNFELKKVDTEKLEWALADDMIWKLDYGEFLEEVGKSHQEELKDPESKAPSVADLERAMNNIDEEDLNKLLGGNTWEWGLDGFLDRMHNEIWRDGWVWDGPSDTSWNGDGWPSDGWFEM